MIHLRSSCYISTLLNDMLLICINDFDLVSLLLVFVFVLVDGMLYNAKHYNFINVFAISFVNVYSAVSIDS